MLGVFLLKMISMHVSFIDTTAATSIFKAGNIMCARLTEQLWLRHSRLYRQKLLLSGGLSRKDSNASHHSRYNT